MRGEFIRADGLVLPNNISKEGARVILAAAFRNDVPTFFAALVKGPPSPTMTSGSLTEPTLGTNGYARVAIPRSSVGWPAQGEVGGERFVESDWLTWAATGAGFNQSIQRVALMGTNTFNVADPIYALSAPLPAELTILSTTVLADRRFKYRIYI